MPTKVANTPPLSNVLVPPTPSRHTQRCKGWVHSLRLAHGFSQEVPARSDCGGSTALFPSGSRSPKCEARAMARSESSPAVGMAQGKQAKTLIPKQEAAVLRHLHTSRYTKRNRVMFLLSVEAGLRAKEIASLTWGMVTDANGEIADEISLPNSASKGNNGGRTIPLNAKLKGAIVHLYESTEGKPQARHPVVCSERGRGRMFAASVTVWFHRLYGDLGLIGCSKAIAAGEPSLHVPLARSSRRAEACGMSSSWLVMRILAPRNAILRATAKPSVSSST